MTAIKEPHRKVPGQEVTEADARQVAEAARETEWSAPSFVRELFLGNLRLDLIDPPPTPDPEEQARAAVFLRDVQTFLDNDVDAEAIDVAGKVPEDVLDGLRRLGAFGIKIPLEYGGLGLSQVSHNHAIGLIGA